jgi:hypothetical protein
MRSVGLKTKQIIDFVDAIGYLIDAASKTGDAIGHICDSIPVSANI